jgi:hypothetical protein
MYSTSAWKISVAAEDFAAWMAGRNPDYKTIYASYSDDLGTRMNLRVPARTGRSGAWHGWPWCALAIPFVQWLVTGSPALEATWCPARPTHGRGSGRALLGSWHLREQ